MKTLVSVCLVALVLFLGLTWWLRTDGPAVDAKADAVRNPDVVRNTEVSPAVQANPVIARSGQTPPRWVPSDAERVDDRGALTTWVPYDAERVDDRGASLTWTPTDAERDDDQGASLTWTAHDAERDDDVGVQVHGGGIRG